MKRFRADTTVTGYSDGSMWKSWVLVLTEHARPGDCLFMPSTGHLIGELDTNDLPAGGAGLDDTKLKELGLVVIRPTEKGS